MPLTNQGSLCYGFTEVEIQTEHVLLTGLLFLILQIFLQIKHPLVSSLITF